jgi:glutathione peroxidase
MYRLRRRHSHTSEGLVLSMQLQTRILLSIAALALVAAPVTKAQDRAGATVKSFYEMKTTYLDGKPADLAAFKGKVTLVVNVASKCGYTPQYEGLEKLHKELSAKGNFSVLGFPSNDFGGQEPGTPEEIATFCKRTYDVDFPMFSKVVTKAGDNQSQIYKFLGTSNNLPKWNFSKYVIDKNGKIVAFFPSAVKPDAPELKEAISKALAQ